MAYGRAWLEEHAGYALYRKIEGARWKSIGSARLELERAVANRELAATEPDESVTVTVRNPGAFQAEASLQHLNQVDAATAYRTRRPDADRFPLREVRGTGLNRLLAIVPAS